MGFIKNILLLFALLATFGKDPALAQAPPGGIEREHREWSQEEQELIERSIAHYQKERDTWKDTGKERFFTRYLKLLDNLKTDHAVNGRDDKGVPLFMMAWFMEDLPLCELVLKHGADPDVEVDLIAICPDELAESQKDKKARAIELCFIYKDGTFCKLLLKYKADTSVIYDNPWTRMLLGMARKYSHQLKDDQDVFLQLAEEGRVEPQDGDRNILFGR